MRTVLSILLIPLWLSTTGCTHVKPWERGQLTKGEMAFDVDPMETKIKQHIYVSNEGSSSGSSLVGGGSSASEMFASQKTN